MFKSLYNLHTQHNKKINKQCIFLRINNSLTSLFHLCYKSLLKISFNKPFKSFFKCNLSRVNDCVFHLMLCTSHIRDNNFVSLFDEA